MNGIILPVASLMLSSFIILLFFSKTRSDNVETKIYSKALICNLIYSFMAVEIYILAKMFVNEQILELLQKSYYMVAITLLYILANYLFNVIDLSEVKIKIYSSLLGVVNFIACLFIFILDMEIINYDSVFDGIGPSYFAFKCSYVVYILIALVIVISRFKNNRSFKDKKLMPFCFMLVFFSLGFIMSIVLPSLIYETYLFSFFMLIMYHTMENPDVKLINELNYVKEMAVKSNRAKSDFLSSMSHEVRTPLNGIIGLSENLLNNKDNINSDLEDIRDASLRLLDVVGNILDVNMIDNSSVNVNVIPYNLIDEISSVIKINNSRIGNKDIIINLDVSVDVPSRVIGDKDKVISIVNNLLNNSIKFTDSGSINIVVSSKYVDEGVNLIISVEDSGRGMKRDVYQNLFKRFQRDNGIVNSDVSGTGLGMSITKSLVDILGGSIDVSSKVGVGSKFTVTLLHSVVNEMKVIKVYSPKKNDVKKTLNVLIVDDNKLNIKVLRRHLEVYDFLIDECYDGLECLDKIKVNNFDLILMDIMMPNMDGTVAISKIREDKSFLIPVIAVTADAVVGAREKYLSMGFDDYVSKPFSGVDIAKVLSNVVNLDSIKK